MKSLNAWLKDKLGPNSDKSSEPSPPRPSPSASEQPVKTGDPTKPKRHRSRGRKRGHGGGEGAAPSGSTPQTPSRPASTGRGGQRNKREPQPRMSSPSKTPRAPRKVVEPAHDYFRVVIIGGLNEVGRNCAVFETREDMVMIDCGLMFPEADMFGIDYVIPDVAYIEERLHKFRGIIITHGHLDHIGGLRHVLPKLHYPPIYGSRMSVGLIKKNLEEYGHLDKARLHEVSSEETIRLGGFSAGFIKVTHSVPGSFAIDLKNGNHRVIHTGDFKFDFTAPFPNDVPDFERLAQAGEEGVTYLMSDSTNATTDGYTRPEVTVAESLREIITRPTGRIIVGTVSSNIARIQSMVNVAREVDRQVFIAGRSMVNNVEIAKRLQYMNWSERHVQKLSNAANDLPDEKVLIITTGSQGEQFAALTRMANDSHPQIKIKKGDTIAFSATPIPGTGNERSVTNMINKFIAKGAHVITNEDLDLHSSGHGKKEDLKMMLSLVKPKYFIPVHGELFMRLAHKNLGIETGIASDDNFLLENGSIIELSPNAARPVVHDKLIGIRNIYIDGLGGTENEDDHVLEDRKTMSRDGVAVVLFRVSRRDGSLQGLPRIISKGFIYLDEHAELTGVIAAEAAKAYEKAIKKDPREASVPPQPLPAGEATPAAKPRRSARSSAKSHRDLRSDIRFHLSKVILKKIDREPVIAPIIVEV